MRDSGDADGVQMQSETIPDDTPTPTGVNLLTYGWDAMAHVTQMAVLMVDCHRNFLFGWSSDIGTLEESDKFTVPAGHPEVENVCRGLLGRPPRAHVQPRAEYAAWYWDLMRLARLGTTAEVQGTVVCRRRP